MLNRKNFARVGNTPGKTIHVNYFRIDEKLYFIDLPGYGFANISKSERERWSRLMESFFSDCENITLGILIVDARHKPTADDINMNEYFKTNHIPYCVVANKIDKLKKSEYNDSINEIVSVLNLSLNDLVPFSAEKGTGKDLLVAKIVDIC